MKYLIQANLHYLKQAELLLEPLSDLSFCQPAESFYRSSIGSHLRHCLDHYDSFNQGLASGEVDYDKRMRLPELESETARALAKTREVSAALRSIDLKTHPLQLLVKMDCGMGETNWQPSSLGRELQFLISHTIHHFAMIGGICNEVGVALPPDFGIAPSTLRHRAEVCA